MHSVLNIDVFISAILMKTISLHPYYITTIYRGFSMYIRQHPSPYLNSYLVAVRFIGGGNMRTRRKPPTGQTLSRNNVSSSHRHERN